MVSFCDHNESVQSFMLINDRIEKKLKTKYTFKIYIFHTTTKLLIRIHLSRFGVIPLLLIYMQSIMSELPRCHSHYITIDNPFY